MTDNKIIKALKECEECHYYNDCEKSTRLALDLINRQKAEIERLKPFRDAAYDALKTNYFAIKAEAIKEFADLSIKRICKNVTAPTPTESYIVERCSQEIDNLVKEMEKDK